MAFTIWRRKEPKQTNTAPRNAAKKLPLPGNHKLLTKGKEVMNLSELGAALANMPLPQEARAFRLLVRALVEDAFNALADPVSREWLEEKPDSKFPLGSQQNPRTREGNGKLLVDPLPDGEALVMDFATLKEAMGLIDRSYDTVSLLKVLVLAMVDEAFIEHAKNPTGAPPVAA